MKRVFNIVLLKIKSSILNYFKHFKRSNYLFLILLFCINASTYVSFAFTKNATYELMSQNMTEISNKYSCTGSTNIDIISKADSNYDSLYSETYNSLMANYTKTTGSFYNYRTLYNSNVADYVLLNELNNESITILTHTNGSKAHKNLKDEFVYSWFEIKVMFEDTMVERESNDLSYCLIRQTTANQILTSHGIEPELDSGFSESQYNFLRENISLKGTYVYGGESLPVSWTIGNIILNNEGYDAFFEKTFGNYITLCIYKKNALPSYKGFSINFDFGSSIFDTSRYLQMIEKKYLNSEYEVSISNYNLNKQDENLENLKNGILNNFNNTHCLSMTICIIFALILYTLVLLSFVIYILRTNFYSYFYLLDVALCFVFTYLIFFCAFMIKTSNVILFTTNAIGCNIVFSLVFSLVLVMIIYYKNKSISSTLITDSFCEVNI